MKNLLIATLMLTFSSCIMEASRDNELSYKNEVIKDTVTAVSFDTVIITDTVNLKLDTIQINRTTYLLDTINTITYRTTTDTVLIYHSKIDTLLDTRVDTLIIKEVYDSTNTTIIQDSVIIKGDKSDTAVILDSGGDRKFIIDPRDNKPYTIKSFGKQLWLTENVSHMTTSTGTCIGNCKDFNIGYTWDESLNICPMGSRLPTFKDFNVLASYLINEIGYINMFDNELFNADLVGYHEFGSTRLVDSLVGFWVRDFDHGISYTRANAVYLRRQHEDILEHANPLKTAKFSVRCIIKNYQN